MSTTKQIVTRGHTRPLTEISFVQDGPEKTILVSSAHDKTPQIRNGETGDWIGSFQGHKGAVWSAKIDALTRTLAATGSGDFTAKIWCANTGKELFDLKHKHVVKSVDFSMDTLKLATGCQDGRLRVYDVVNPTQAPLELEAQKLDGIMRISWSNDQKDLLIVGKVTGAIDQWDIRVDPKSGPVLTRDLGTSTRVMDFDISLPHNTMLAASKNKVFALQLNTLDIIKEYTMPSPMHFNDEGGVSLSPDGTRFMAGASDLWLREFDYPSGEMLRVFKGHHGPIRCVRYHPSGNVVASGSEDGTIRLWDLQFNNLV